MAGNFFRGTTAEQDPRWGNADKKMINEMAKTCKFPKIFDTKVLYIEGG